MTLGTATTVTIMMHLLALQIRVSNAYIPIATKSIQSISHYRACSGDRIRSSSLSIISYMSIPGEVDTSKSEKEELTIPNPTISQETNTSNTLSMTPPLLPPPMSRRTKLKTKLKSFTTRFIAPQSIAAILSDATAATVDLAVEEVANQAVNAQSKLTGTSLFSNTKMGKVLRRRALSKLLEEEATLDGDTALSMDTIALAKTAAADAFSSAEQAIAEAELALNQSKEALELCKDQVREMIAVAEQTAMEANLSSMRATALATSAALSVEQETTDLREEGEVDNKKNHGEATNEPKSIIENAETTTTKTTTIPTIDTTVSSESPTLTTTVNLTNDSLDISTLSYEDVDYHLSEMAPPFLDSSMCLIPGEPIVRVERAPSNSRRIFAGIDIMSSVDDVWNVLTDYDNLQNVVPNLVINEVLERYESDIQYPFSYEIRTDVKSEEQCRALSTRMRGATMKQVGGAKVVGINFSARTTLEVREWPQGMPDFFHFSEDLYQGESRTERAQKEVQTKLERYHFPRPFAISELPTKDISMQSIENDDGEFRLYQGVWRMQPLPGCSPADGSSEAMRLTYAVEISPRPYLPVGLIEGRITQDLCNNLIAIRDYVTTT